MPRDGAPTRQRILDTAERLVIDNGFRATSVDQVIAESATSKGSFFHHFASKADLGRALVRRYADADIAQLHWAQEEIAEIDDPAERVIAFVKLFEDCAEEIMAEQSSCLYIAALAEQQLMDEGTTDPVAEAVVAWREGIAALLAEAGIDDPAEADALADHVFVTFEGAFLLCRCEGDPGHMRTQLRTLRQLLAARLALVTGMDRRGGEHVGAGSA